MKKAVLSLLVLIIILVLLRHDALDLLTSDIFHYTAYGTFLVVMICAVYFVGIRKNGESEKPEQLTQQRKDNADEKEI